jgi:hypothetical protein
VVSGCRSTYIPVLLTLLLASSTSAVLILVPASAGRLVYRVPVVVS